MQSLQNMIDLFYGMDPFVQLVVAIFAVVALFKVAMSSIKIALSAAAIALLAMFVLPTVAPGLADQLGISEDGLRVDQLKETVGEYSQSEPVKNALGHISSTKE